MIRKGILKGSFTLVVQCQWIDKQEPSERKRDDDLIQLGGVSYSTIFNR